MRNLYAFLAACVLVSLLTFCGCTAREVTKVDQLGTSGVQILSPEELKTVFGLSTQQYDELMKLNPPHFKVFGTVRFQMNDMLPWMRENFYENERKSSAQGES